LHENRDFVIFHPKVNKSGPGRPSKDYLLTHDAASHLGMMQDTEKGREVRTIFIEAKKQYMAILTGEKPLPLQDNREDANRILRLNLEAASLLSVPLHLAQIEAVKEAVKVTGIDYSPLLQLSSAMDNIPKEEMFLEPTELGKQHGITAQQTNKLLSEKGFQVKTNKQWMPTEKAKGLYSMHAWSKGSKSGYNLKWKLSSLT
jgi:hypothetical protein